MLNDVGSMGSDGSVSNDQGSIDGTMAMDMGQLSDMNAPVAPGCRPTQEGFEAVRPILESACGQCHGETPQFGAPYSLMEYDDLVDGSRAAMKLDALIREVRRAQCHPMGSHP